MIEMRVAIQQDLHVSQLEPQLRDVGLNHRRALRRRPVQ
jgi:hypothetical protein